MLKLIKLFVISTWQDRLEEEQSQITSLLAAQTLSILEKLSYCLQESKTYNLISRTPTYQVVEGGVELEE